MGVAFALVVLGAAAPSIAVSPGYPTTALVPSGAAWTQLGGYPGVSANYTNNFASNFQGLVFVDIYNAAGQSVMVVDGSASYAAGQKVDSFIPVVGLPSGNYTAQLFCVTATNVPLSVTSTHRLSA